MRKLFFFIIVFTFTFFSKSRAVSSTDSADIAPFGKVYVYKQTDTPWNVVILISEDGGWYSFEQSIAFSGNPERSLKGILY